MQLTPKVGFLVFGVHKDGLHDPMGTPFIDDALIAQAKAALRAAGVELVEHDIVLATKAEARACLNKFKKTDDLDARRAFLRAPGFGPRTWSPRCATSPRPARGSCSGRIPARRAGGRSAGW